MIANLCITAFMTNLSIPASVSQLDSLINQKRLAERGLEYVQPSTEEQKQGAEYALKVWNFRETHSHSHFIQVKNRFAPKPFDHTFIPLHVREYVREETAVEEKSALLFLPGLRTPEVKGAFFIERIWDKIPSSDAFVADLRAQGRSSSSSGYTGRVDLISFEEYLDDIEALVLYIKSKGYSKIVLAAHSTPALAVTELLAQRPQLQKLIAEVVMITPMIDPSPSPFGWGDKGRVKAQLATKLVSIAQHFDFMKNDELSLGYDDKVVLTPNEKSYVNNHNRISIWGVYYAQLMDLSSIDALAQYVYNFGPTYSWLKEVAKASNWVRRADLSSIKTKITMFNSTADRVVDPRTAAQVCRKIPNCQEYRFKGFHDLPYEIPDYTNFMDGVVTESLVP